MSDISEIAAAQQAQLMGLLGFGNALAGTIINAKQNKRNLEQQHWANTQNIAQAEKAYQRSKPTAQVANMRQVGMSQAGAINALNGGGSYTPAPVQPAQEQMLDFSGMQNALANMAQVGLANAQLKEQKRQFNETLQFEKDKFEEEKIDKGYNRVIGQLQANILHSEDAIKNLEYLQKLSTHDEEINAQNAESIARRSTAILEDIRSKRVVDAMSRMTDEELDNLFELQATLNMLQQGLQYDSTSAMIKGAKKLLKFISGGKGAGKNIRTS